MIRVGVLESLDDEHVRFVTTLHSKGANNPDDIIRQLSNNINRFCQTLFHNMNIEENDDSLFQIEYLSNDIDSIDHQDFINETRKRNHAGDTKGC